MAILGMLVAVSMGWTLCPSAPAQTSLSTGGSPDVFFPEKAFEFPPVIDGVKVVHDFVVANRGTEPLAIENVRTG
jgi:hypothetical protein